MSADDVAPVLSTLLLQLLHVRIFCETRNWGGRRKWMEESKVGR